MLGRCLTRPTAILFACALVWLCAGTSGSVLSAANAADLAETQRQWEAANSALKTAEADADARRQVVAALRSAAKMAAARVEELTSVSAAAVALAERADQREVVNERAVRSAETSLNAAVDLGRAARTRVLLAQAAYQEGIHAAEEAEHAAVVAQARAIVAAADSPRLAKGQVDLLVNAFERAAEAARREAMRRAEARDALGVQADRFLEALRYREDAVARAEASLADQQSALAVALAASRSAWATAEQARLDVRTAELEQRAATAAATDAKAAADKATSLVADRRAERDRLALLVESLRHSEQRVAILYEEPVDGAGADATVTAVNAEVTWKYVSDGPNGPEVEASLDVPERNMTIQFSLHKNADETLPASHLVEVVVATPADFPGKAIGSIPRILLKPTEDAAGQPLVGAAAKVADGFFWIALSAADNDIASNLSLMRERNWIDLPLVYENGQRAILTFEKGPDGEAAFQQALAAWGPDPGPDVVTYRLTIPAGLTSRQVIDCLATDMPADGESLLTLTAEQEAACREAAGGLTGPQPSLPAEGALAPGTYAFLPGQTRAGLLDLMIRERDAVVAEVWKRRASDLPIQTPDELVTLASIVETETAIDDERGRIAAVLLNRLRLGMRLQSDSTFIYGIYGGSGKPDGYVATARDRDRPTPYNTYSIDGLPPGPIGNPGRASLEAVANPARTRDLFFVADGSGGHVFAETYEEHLRNVKRLRLPRFADCTNPPDASFGGKGATFQVCHSDVRGERRAFVSIVGRLAEGDEKLFNRALLTTDAPTVVIVLESPGGSVEAGLRIGRTIWRNEYATIARGECKSMCALVWLAGRPRYVLDAGVVGFHAPWQGDAADAQVSAVGSALVGGYLQDLGMTRAAIAYMTEPGPDEIQVLTRQDAQRLGVAFEEWPK